MATHREQRLAKVRRRHEQLLALGTEEHYLDAALYDYEYAERTQDVRWYREIAGERAGEAPILELGAGTGRVTCPIARDGHEIIALDRMPSMLDALQKRTEGKDYAERIDLREGDMRAIPISDGESNLVLAPFNGLMHLYVWQDLLRCFREVHRVLAPGGTFAFDVQIPDLDWLLLDPEERHCVTRFVHPVTAERLVYSTNHRYDPGTQVCHIKIYYDDAPPRGRKFRPPEKPKKVVHLSHRQIWPEELRMLVANGGFDLESLTGDFNDLSLADTVDSQVVVCTKPR